MVRIASTIKDASSKERIEKIKDLEEDRRKKLDDIEKKRKEIEEEKKGLDEEEKKSKDEIESAEIDLKKSMYEVLRFNVLAEQEKFEDDEREKRKNQVLEESVVKGFEEEREKGRVTQGVVYGNALEEIKQGTSIYRLTNYNVYNELIELRNKAAAEGLSPEEAERIDIVRNEFERVSQKEKYVNEKDEFGYVKRSLSVLDQIENYKSR